MFALFFTLGLFSLGCNGVSITPGNYDVTTSIITDECDFFTNTEFENETWVFYYRVRVEQLVQIYSFLSLGSKSIDNGIFILR